MAPLKYQAVNSRLRKRFGYWSLLAPVRRERLLLQIDSYVVLHGPNFPGGILLVIAGPDKLVRLRTEQLCTHP